MASGSYRNGAPKVSSKLDRPPSVGFSTPKPSTKSRQPAGPASGFRRGNSGPNAVKDDAGVPGRVRVAVRLRPRNVEEMEAPPDRTLRTHSDDTLFSSSLSLPLSFLFSLLPSPPPPPDLDFSKHKVCTSDETCRLAKISELFVYENFSRVPAESVEAGDICAVYGVSDIMIGETIADRSSSTALPSSKVEEPTVRMSFAINTSPLLVERENM